jgi:hypothetical protein
MGKLAKKLLDILFPRVVPGIFPETLTHDGHGLGATPPTHKVLIYVPLKPFCTSPHPLSLFFHNNRTFSFRKISALNTIQNFFSSFPITVYFTFYFPTGNLLHHFATPIIPRIPFCQEQTFCHDQAKVLPAKH